MHKTHFLKGIVAGSIVGIAASALAVEQMHPGFSSRLMKNGKKMVGKYKRNLNF